MHDRAYGPNVAYGRGAETLATGRPAVADPTRDRTVDQPGDRPPAPGARCPRRPTPTITVTYEYVGDVPEATQADIRRRIATIMCETLRDGTPQAPERTAETEKHWTSIQGMVTVSHTAARSGRGA